MSLDKKTVADRYAKALFELVDADNELDQIYRELIALHQVFEDNEGLDAALAGVQLSLGEKKSLIKDLQQGTSKYVTNLIQVVLDYGCIDCIAAITGELERQYGRKVERMRADVTTAIQLDKQQENQLKADPAKRFGANKVTLTECVNPEILDRITVHVGNKTLDDSLDSKIKQIRRLLVK